MKTTLLYPGIAGYGFDSLGKGMEAGWISHGLATSPPPPRPRASRWT